MNFFPFGGHGEQGDYEDINFYQVLGVQQDATQQEIKLRYQQLIQTHNPDKTGDQQKFYEIQEAYQILGDPKKRSQYDKQLNQQSHGHQANLFDMLMGKGAKQNKNQMPKVKATKKPLEITLQQSFNGDVLKIPHKRYRICSDCSGKGGQDIKKCQECKGKGIVVKLVQMGPGMYQQIQQHCPSCQGTGEIIKQESRCKICIGKKIIEKQTIIQVIIKRGTPHENVITILGEGDQIPECSAGDLIFVVTLKKHDHFVRIGNDLNLKMKIPLIEALTGSSFEIQHLDGKKYIVATSQEEIICDKQKKIINNLGMPVFNKTDQFGKLIVEFEIEMPAKGSIKEQNFEILAKLISGNINPKPQDHHYQLLQDFTHDDLNTNQQGGRKNEDQQEPEGQTVQCGTH